MLYIMLMSFLAKLVRSMSETRGDSCDVFCRCYQMLMMMLSDHCFYLTGSKSFPKVLCSSNVFCWGGVLLCVWLQSLSVTCKLKCQAGFFSREAADSSGHVSVGVTCAHEAISWQTDVSGSVQREFVSCLPHLLHRSLTPQSYKQHLFWQLDSFQTVFT